MNIKHNILFLLLIFVANTAYSDVFFHEKSINSIIKKLPDVQNRNCKFTQDKYIPSSNLHIKSSGDFKFEKGIGITFYTTYPVKNTISYTQNENKQISKIINAIANKNYSKLEETFKFYYEEINGTWTLGLRPKKDTKSADFIASIEISGEQEINKIIITTFDKTQTTIIFMD